MTSSSLAEIILCLCVCVCVCVCHYVSLFCFTIYTWRQYTVYNIYSTVWHMYSVCIVSLSLTLCQVTSFLIRRRGCPHISGLWLQVLHMSEWSVDFDFPSLTCDAVLCVLLCTSRFLKHKRVCSRHRVIVLAGH